MNAPLAAAQIRYAEAVTAADAAFARFKALCAEKIGPDYEQQIRDAVTAAVELETPEAEAACDALCAVEAECELEAGVITANSEKNAARVALIEASLSAGLHAARTKTQREAISTVAGAWRKQPRIADQLLKLALRMDAREAAYGNG